MPAEPTPYDSLPDDPELLRNMVATQFSEGEEGDALRAELDVAMGFDPVTGARLDPNPSPTATVTDPPPEDPPPAATATPAPSEETPPADPPPADPTPPADAPPKPSEEIPPAAAATPPSAETPPGSEETPAGILTRDGEHVIPYDVLEASRSENAALRARVDALEGAARVPEWLERLTARAPAAPAPTETPPAATPAPDPERERMLTSVEAQIAHVESEYGEEVAAPLKTMANLIKTQAPDQAAQTRINALEERIETLIEAGDRTVQAESARMVERHPVLAQWFADWQAAEAGDTTRSGKNWEESRELDDWLLTRPQWQDRPAHERMAHVVKMMGGGETPASGTPQATSPTPPSNGSTPPEVPTPARRAPPRDPAMPGSLSDAPLAGIAPELNEDQTALLKLDPMQIAERMQRMTPEQLNEFYASVS